jgi:LysM repeat protein
MAGYLWRFYYRDKRRFRRRLGVISAIIIVAVFICVRFSHRFFNRNQDQAAAASPANNTPLLPKPPEAVVLQPKKSPNLELKLSKTIPLETSEPNPKVAELMDEAAELVNSGSAGIIEARDRLNKALSMPMNNAQRAVIKQKLSALADKWLFSREVLPNDTLCSRYKVEPGELLSAISNDHRVPWEILMEANRIDRPELLRAGEIIKVIHGPFHARIRRSTFTMDLYLQDTFVRSFRVGIGRPGRETPTGLWRVKLGGKLISPKWTDPDTYKTYKADDPDYPLGSRWIALEGISGEAEGRRGFAIHGTKKPEEIGTAGSRGCIRLYNGDAIMVYNLLTPGLSRVEVVE